MASRRLTPPVLLGPGASGDARGMRPYVEGLASRGVTAATVPVAGRLPLNPGKAMALFVAAAEATGRPAILGGQSFGGRMASMVAAGRDPAVGAGGALVAGLVLFSYPLHPPGKPERLRTEHWPDIRCPVLLLSGESDPFAEVGLLRNAVELLPRAELVTYPGIGHGLARYREVFSNALDRVAAFAAAIAPTPPSDQVRR